MMMSDVCGRQFGMNTSTGSVSLDRDDRAQETEQARRAIRAATPMAFGPLAYIPEAGESERPILALGLSHSRRSGWDAE